MLLHRFITAIILIAILVPIALWGGVPGITLIVLVLGLTALFELSRNLPGLKETLPQALTMALGFAVAIGAYLLPFDKVIAVPVLFPLIAIILHVFLYKKITNTVDSAAQMIFAVSYVLVSLSHAILLRRLEPGPAWVFFVLVSTCLGDVGAYFAGRFLGKHKLAPTISPAKTVEGLGGAFIGALVGMVIVKLIFPDLPSFKLLIPLALCVAASGSMGDLCASAVKRRLKIKDFGSVMPGHGGVMDRADSLILSFPTTFYFLLFSGHAALT